MDRYLFIFFVCVYIYTSARVGKTQQESNKKMAPTAQSRSFTTQVVPDCVCLCTTRRTSRGPVPCLFAPLSILFSSVCLSLPLCLPKSIEIPVSWTWHAALRPSQYSRCIMRRYIFLPDETEYYWFMYSAIQSHLCRQLSKRSRPTSARTFTKPSPWKCTIATENGNLFRLQCCIFMNITIASVIIMEIGRATRQDTCHE
jgi:hypothetical protein